MTVNVKYDKIVLSKEVVNMSYAEELFESIKKEPTCNSFNMKGILDSSLEIGFIDRTQYLLLLTWLKEHRD